MHARFLTALAILFSALLPQVGSAGPPIMLDKETIDVTTSFRGTQIELTSFLGDDADDVKMTIIGPPATLTFRRKARVAGLWINAEKQILDGAASYIALVGVTESELDAACTNNALPQLTHDNMADISWACDPRQRNLMAGKGLFVLDPGNGVSDLGAGFIRAQSFLPPTAKPGSYGLRFWANGESTQTELNVRRAGLERWILTTAQNHRLLYGLLCLILAGLAGYLTNLVFSRRT